MKKIAALSVAILAVAMAAWLWLRPPRSRPLPCFLIVAIDSLRADHVGAYGYPRATTPRIDALSRSGVVFDQAFTQAPWTKPSVASIFTSTYISVHRVLYSKQVIDGQDRSDILNEKFLTLAEAMKAGGFATAGFGQKIHLRPEFGFSQGFDGYDMHLRRAEGINRAAIAWLSRLRPERFFMYLHYNDPHYPYKPRREDATFGATTTRVQIDGRTKKAFHDGSLQITREDMRALEDLYDGEIHYTDRHVGALLDAIATMGYSDVTVLVTADHGEEFLDHGDITHGQSLYGELVRVPFILAGPGLPAALAGHRGRHVATPVQLIDIMPTLLEMAGLPLPPGVQGSSVVARLSSHPAPQVFSERRSVDEVAFWGTVFDGRWKLIQDATKGRTLLFDTMADPGETLPLQDRNPGVVAGLAERMKQWAAGNHILYERIQPESTRPLDPETEERLRSLGYID